MTRLEQYMIDHALTVAAGSTCRSKRGVVLYNMSNGAFRGAGYNGPPELRMCPGRSICAGTCGKRSVHAEVRALRAAEEFRRHHESGPFDLIHVERAEDGSVVACDGPSCWQCAREILDVGFVAGVWLYERMPDEWCPHRDERRVDCSFCQGVDCIADHGKCVASDYGPCPHDVLERHGGLPVVDARWRRYTAEDFYSLTLRNCGIPT